MLPKKPGTAIRQQRMPSTQSEKSTKILSPSSVNLGQFRSSTVPKLPLAVSVALYVTFSVDIVVFDADGLIITLESESNRF